MRVKIDTVNPFPRLSARPDCDLLVTGFNTNERIRYGKELSGETNYLKEIAALSEKYEMTVVSAFDTDNYGIIRQSACVFDKGKLLGIADMTVSYEDSPYMPGGNGRLFDTSAGKIAVSVGDDIYSYDLMRSFAVCGAEAIVSVRREKPKEMDGVLLRAYAYLTGIPVVSVSGKMTALADCDGNLTTESDNGIFDAKTYAEYILKITKVRFNK